MTEQNLPNLPQQPETPDQESSAESKNAFFKTMDERGYTGAYERYHTHHGEGSSSVKLSEEKKKEIRERVAQTLAERMAQLGVPLQEDAGDTNAAAQSETPAPLPTQENPQTVTETDSNPTPETENTEESQSEPTLEAVQEEELQKELTQRLFEKQSTQPSAEDGTQQMTMPRGIVTGETMEAEPFSYTNFKLKRANAVKDFFNNMHEFTFTRTNQEAVEMLHMHPQKNSEKEEVRDISSGKDEEANLLQERVENIYHIITGEKQMSTLRTIVTAVLSVLSLLFLTVHVGDAGLYFCGANMSPIIIASIQMLILVLGGVASTNIFIGAWQLFQNRRFGKEMLVSLIYVAGLIFGIFSLTVPSIMSKEFYSCYTPLYMLSLFSYHLGVQLQMGRLQEQFERTAEDHSTLRYSLEPLENRFLLQNLDIQRKENSLVVKQVKGDMFSGFEDHGFSPDWFDNLTKPFMIGLTVCACIASIGSLILSGEWMKGILVFLGAFAFCGPFAAMFAAELPMRRACKEQNEIRRNISQSFTILHADAADAMADAGAVIVSSDALFPPESVLLHGLRSASGVRVDEAILDAVSILTAGKSVLAPTFLQMISDKKELLKPVDSITYEDGMGISAWVDNNRVLIGSRKLMENHNIRMPSEEIEQAESDKGRMVLYLARRGELITAFTLTLNVPLQVKHFLGQAKSRGMYIYVKSVDCLIENHLFSLFGEDADVIGILPSRLHADYDKETTSTSPSLSMVLSDGSLFSALHAVQQLQKIRASLEINRLLVVILAAITGVFYLAAAIAGSPVLISAAVGLIPVLLHSGFFLLKR